MSSKPDYLWDRSGEPDADVAGLESLLAPLAHDAPLDEMRLRRRRPRMPWIVGGALVAAAAAALLYLARPGPTPSRCGGTTGMAFQGVGGSVACEGVAVARGVLPVGGTLETGSNQATLTIADIGSAQLGSATRLRLERTGTDRHQLALDRGTMHAKVVARPRLFAVTTPTIDVVDLGCEYDITIGDTGAGRVTVHDGLVELATKTGSIVVVPEGCTAAILGAQRPGLPICKATTPAVAAAATAYDAGDPAAAATIIARAERPDAIVLVALAAIDPERRAVVLSRLAELSPPPDVEIDPETAAADPALMATWRQDVFEIYFGLFGPDATPR